MATWGAELARNGEVESSSISDTGSSRSSGAESMTNYGAGTSKDTRAGSSTNYGAGSSRSTAAGSSKDGFGDSSRSYGAGSTRSYGTGSTRSYGTGSTRSYGAGSTINLGAGSSRDSYAESTRSYGAGSTINLGAGSSKDSEAGSSRSKRPRTGDRMVYKERSRYLDLSDDDDEESAMQRTDFDSATKGGKSRRNWDRLNSSMCGRAVRHEEIEPLGGFRSKKFPDVKIMAETDEGLHRNTSFPFLAGGDVLTAVRRSQDGSPLLRGPRRVLRLCLFAVLLPLTLVLVPLYVRLVIYRPQVYAMAPSDQRLVDAMVSSVWCQGQGVHMNGSFNAYLVPHVPPTSRSRPRYTILKNLQMRDDVKEYWGFYLKEGSTVTLSTCTRYDGGQLLILRGSENLRKCAWIGEEDSLEELNDRPPTAEDLKHLRVATDANSDEYEDAMTNSRIGSRTFKANNENINVETVTTADDESPPNFRTSEERQGHVSRLLNKALRMSKGKNELMDLLHAHQESSGSGVEGVARARQNSTSQSAKMSDSQGNFNGRTVNSLTGDSKLEDDSVRSRTARDLQQDDRDGAFEVTDDEPTEVFPVKKFTRQEIGAEQIIGGLKIPDGLTYERGFVNQSHNNDLSREEHMSSYSSSEEALAKCEGVILALALRPDSQCANFNHIQSNKISYDITVDGTYYFVFSSDNEIVINDLYFNLTLDKVVYDTSKNLANCTASNNCSLSFGFWSDDKTVVEVPADGTFDNSFVLSTTCEPRVALYLCFMLLVPVLILFCALQ